MPFIFPEAITHLYVATMVELGLLPTIKTKGKVVSAGFVSLGLDTDVNGESESLGGLKSIPADAARIVLGDSVAFMPDALAEMMLERAQHVASVAAEE